MELLHVEATWPRAPSSSSRPRQVPRPARAARGPRGARLSLEAGLVAAVAAAARGRTAREAQGRLVRPPLPPYMEPAVQSEAITLSPREEEMVHPATQALEDAMSTDSLKTLCKALAAAAGTFSPDESSSSVERARRPKMDAPLAIRALLRYCELRYSAGDDLKPKDFLGRSGMGLRALLRTCRQHQFEVTAELESRGEDVVRMIRAFHDQAEMISKYLPFFRMAIEKSMPAILRQNLEPLPQLISFLEPFGEIQLSLLYEAAKDKVLKARLDQLDPRQLLEVTDKWVSRARSGKLAIIMQHKARMVVRRVASLDIELAPRERANWLGLAMWGSVLVPTEEQAEEVQLIEDRLRRGAFHRGNPVEMLSIAERMAEIHGLNEEMFHILRLPLLEAMTKAPQKAAEALASLTFATGYILRVPEEKARLVLPERLRKRFKIWKIGEDPPVGKLKKREPAPPAKPKEAFGLLLTRLMEAFCSVASFLNLEIVLQRWVAKGFQLAKCEEVTRDVMLQRLMSEDNLMEAGEGESLVKADAQLILPGPLARCSSHLISLGLPGYTLLPAIDWLLSEPVGWADKRAYPQEVDPQDQAAKVEEVMLERRAAASSLAERSLPLLSHLWPDERREEDERWKLLALKESEELLRMVGPTQEREDGRTRQADFAANKLLQRLAVQFLFPELQTEVELSLRQWRENQPETTLSTMIAPWLLKAAETCAETGTPEELAPGVLSRSIDLLARAMKLEELSLLAAEWALAPFEQAEEGGEAVTLVSSSCSQGGVAKDILSAACRSWLGRGCAPGSLGVELAVKALVAWERDGVRDAGVTHLRQAHRYLEGQLDLGSLAAAPAIEMKLKDATESLGVLIDAIDGVAPSLAQLIKGREGSLGKLGATGRAALADAVALAWSAAMPGLTPQVAGRHFEQWAKGFEGRRSMVEVVASSTLEELRWRLRQKLDRTFADQRSEAYSSPSFRLEGIRKVPWFVPPSVVKEAFEEKPIGLRKPAAPDQGPGFVRTKNATQQALEKMGGRCMYCGGSWKLSPRYIWPHHLGGTELMSNLAAACECCTEMADALGPRRWGEVLNSTPEEAAEVWFEAQKKANMQTVSFLSNQSRAS